MTGIPTPSDPLATSDTVAKLRAMSDRAGRIGLWYHHHELSGGGHAPMARFLTDNIDAVVQPIMCSNGRGGLAPARGQPPRRGLEGVEILLRTFGAQPRASTLRRLYFKTDEIVARVMRQDGDDVAAALAINESREAAKAQARSGRRQAVIIGL